MAGYSDDDSVGGYSDDQCSAGGYSDDQYSAGGYSDDDQHSEGGYSDDEHHAAAEDSDDDQDAPSGYYNPATTTKACDYGGKQTTTYNYEARPGEHSGSYQRTEKATYVDKRTGGFTHTTAKEVISTGDTFKGRGSAGRVGTKNEYTTRETLRVGDKSGYSEYQVQERFRIMVATAAARATIVVDQARSIKVVFLCPVFPVVDVVWSRFPIFNELLSLVVVEHLLDAVVWCYFTINFEPFTLLSNSCRHGFLIWCVPC